MPCLYLGGLLASHSVCWFRLSDRDRQLMEVRHSSEQIRSQLSSKEESLNLVQAECIKLSQQLETLRYAGNFFSSRVYICTSWWQLFLTWYPWRRSQMCSLSKASKSILSVVQACHLRSEVDYMRQTVCGLRSFMKEWSSSVVKFTHEWDRTAAAQRVELEARLHRAQVCSKETEQALKTCRTEMKEKVQELTISISRITGEKMVHPVYVWHLSLLACMLVVVCCSSVLFYLLIFLFRETGQGERQECPIEQRERGVKGVPQVCGQCLCGVAVCVSICVCACLCFGLILMIICSSYMLIMFVRLCCLHRGTRWNNSLTDCSGLFQSCPL